jgi:hypothetical protein
MERTIYLYWVGSEYKLITILRKYMYIHSKHGKGYNIVLLTRKNICDYIEIPIYFDDLKPAHQADYVRVFVLEKYGGMWMDSDTLVMDSMDVFFDLLEKKEGFFFTQGNTTISNGVFASKPNTPLLKEWKTHILRTLEKTPVKSALNWETIGNTFLTETYIKTPSLYQGYEVFKGPLTVYPINWMDCAKMYLHNPYESYKDIIRPFQPFLILVNTVYKELENESVQEIFQKERPLKYFLNKGIENAPLKDLDFLEIGVSNFNMLIEEATDTTVGISAVPLRHYLDQLPDKPNVQKIQAAITNVSETSSIDIYYIPEAFITKNNLPLWLKGCNKIGEYHPLHIKHNLQPYVQVERVPLMAISDVMYTYHIRQIQHLKIDMEGHDCTILQGLFSHIRYLPSSFYPRTIEFESNENTSPSIVTILIQLFVSIGYMLVSRGNDTILKYSN